MKTRHTLFSVLAASALALLAGCGTGSNTTALSSASASGAGRGSVKISIHWPDAPKTRQSRLIPTASQSIAIVMTSDSIQHQWDFKATKLIARPATGNTSTVTIDNLPEAPDYKETATAYPNTDGTGQAQAAGTINNVAVKASQVTTTPDLTMNTTIKSLAVTPSATTATAGGAAVSLTATAKDADGNVVLTAPANIAFTSDKATLGTLSSGSNPAALTPLAAGTVNITATEIESKVASAAVAIVISAGSGGGGGGGTTTNTSNVFVVDSGNNRLVGLDAIPATAFTPFASYNPSSVTLDAQGRIYFSSGARIIRMDDLTGTNQVIYSVPGSNAYFVTLDKQGRIYYYNDQFTLSRIDDITGANLVTYNPTNEFGSHLLNGTSGIAIDSQNRIYVTQSLAGRVMRFDDMTGANTVTFGTTGSGVKQFHNPAQIVIDSSSRIYVADAGNHRIVRFDDITGTNWIAFAIPSTVSVTANFEGVAVDSGANPHIYFTDGANGVVYRMNDLSGSGLVQYGAKGSGTGQFNFPDFLAVK